jgi:hypothetical protein
MKKIFALFIIQSSCLCYVFAASPSSYGKVISVKQCASISASGDYLANVPKESYVLVTYKELKSNKTKKFFLKKR